MGYVVAYRSPTGKGRGAGGVFAVACHQPRQINLVIHQITQRLLGTAWNRLPV